MRGFWTSAALYAVLSTAGATSWAAQPDRWVEARSTHFIVFANTGEKQAGRLAIQFERMQMVFHTLFSAGAADTNPPMVVLAVKDRKGLQALEPQTYLSRNQVDLAGLFLSAPDKNYILVRLDAQEEHAYATVYHEYTHYILRKTENWLPLWLNEGLAQFYENTDFDEKNVWLGQASPQELRYLNRNDLLPIATLLAVDARSPYYHEEDKSSIFYAESWALTHFLIVNDRIGGTHCIRNYAQLVAGGEDPVAAAREAFGDLDKLQVALSDYMLQRKFMYFTMPATLSAQDAAVTLRQVPATEADAVRADIMLYTGRTQESRTLAESVLRDDPGSALAHETLGVLEYHAGQLASAKRWFSQAATLDPHNYLAPYFYATTAVRLGGKDEDPAIESSLRTSFQLNPGFAPAYDALAMFYAARHRNLDEAHTLALRAMDLEPERLAYRLDSAQVLVEENQFADALTVLAQAEHLARTPKEMDLVHNGELRVAHYHAALAGSSSASANTAARQDTSGQ